MSLTKKNEEILDRISSGLAELRELSIDTGYELDNQGNKLDRLIQGTEEITKKVDDSTNDITEMTSGLSRKKRIGLVIAGSAGLIIGSFLGPIIGPAAGLGLMTILLIR